MSEEHTQITSGAGADNLVYFGVFMMVFWPVTLLFGIVDHFFIPDSDLRLIGVLLGLLAGGLGLKAHKTIQRYNRDAY